MADLQNSTTSEVRESDWFYFIDKIDLSTKTTAVILW